VKEKVINCFFLLFLTHIYLKKQQNPPPPAFGAPIGVTAVEFRRDLWRRKTGVPELLCGTVSTILRLAILLEHRLVTDRQTDVQMDGQQSQVVKVSHHRGTAKMPIWNESVRKIMIM